jgi:hypothetical protein
MTRTSGHLFDEAELREWLQERHGECKAELARLPEARLLEQPVDQLAQSFLNRYRVEPIEVHVDRKYAVDRGEIEIWGSGGLATDRVRVRVGGRPGPPGRAIAVHVPFTGDPELLFLRPGTHTFSGPQGHVENSELVFPFESPSEDPLNVEVEATSALSKIEDPYLQSQAEDLGRFNDELSGFITESLAIYAPPATESAIEGRNFATLSPNPNVSGPRRRKPGAQMTFVGASQVGWISPSCSQALRGSIAGGCRPGWSSRSLSPVTIASALAVRASATR